MPHQVGFMMLCGLVGYLSLRRQLSDRFGFIIKLLGEAKYVRLFHSIMNLIKEPVERNCHRLSGNVWLLAGEFHGISKQTNI